MGRKPDFEQRCRQLQDEAESKLADAFECELEAAEAWRMSQTAVFAERMRALAMKYREAASIYESMALECQAALVH